MPRPGVALGLAVVFASGCLAQFDGAPEATLEVSVDEERFRAGEMVTFRFVATNTGSAGLAYPHGCDTAWSATVVAANGTEVTEPWVRVGCLGYREGSLAAGASLAHAIRWNGCEYSGSAREGGTPVPAGDYVFRGRFAHWGNGTAEDPFQAARANVTVVVEAPAPGRRDPCALPER